MPLRTGLDVEATSCPLGFRYGEDMFGPEPELRRLGAIRPSLIEPGCAGPDPVYAIVMDVGRPKHRKQLEDRGLLFGIVAYAAGRLGQEPVRSQGHIHKASRYSGWSTPEIFEIWQGRALILMQEFAGDDPGRSIAIDAGPGDRVVLPPSWAHAVISADAQQPLVFGAWCVRDYGFVYDGVRAHGGLAWFPVIEDDGTISWIRNRHYQRKELTLRPARAYPEMGLDPGISLYDHIEAKPDAIRWVGRPDLIADRWREFEP